MFRLRRAAGSAGDQSDAFTLKELVTEREQVKSRVEACL